MTLNPSATVPFVTLQTLLRTTSNAATDERFATVVIGDTVDRLAIDGNGKFSWGTGALAADTTLARTAAGQLTIGNTLVVGTVLANELKLTTGAAPAAISGSIVQAADANGFAITRPDSASGDTTIYNEGHFTGFSTTDQLVNSTVFATVCAGTTIGTGTYRVHAEMTVVQGPNNASNHYRLGFTGTISQVRAKIKDFTSGGPYSTTVTTSNNGLLTAQTINAGLTYDVVIHAIIVTTSSGTLSIQAAMDAAGNTFTVLALSDFHLEPLS